MDLKKCLNEIETYQKCNEYKKWSLPFGMIKK